MPPPRTPLVPIHLIDAPSQRKYAFISFILLFAYKAYDLVRLYGESHAEAYEIVLAKWCLIDAAFMTLLQLLRIPWLHFSVPSTIVCVATLWLLDALFFSIPTVSWARLIMFQDVT